jgi:pimeloyl-[acyl-carrier protein] methyl ester esterase
MSDPAPHAQNTHSETTDRARLTLLLLPGMDGTGELFNPFIRFLPAWIKPEIVRYSNHVPLGFRDLLPAVRSAIPDSSPFVLLAESFSTPVAVQLAAEGPSNLQAVIICAGFVKSPVGTLSRFWISALAPMLFGFPLPSFVIRSLLVGSTAPVELVRRVRTVVSTVSPQVLVLRLRAVLKCDEQRALSRISVPILYVQAAEDRLVRQSSLETIRAVRADVTIARMAAPHFILQREPQSAADAIVAWLAQHCEPTSS